MAIAGIAVGIVLLVHAGQSCTPNPFNSVYGTDLQDCNTTHPYTGAGAAALVGGVIQGAVIAVVARLCTVVSELREAAP